MEGRKVLTETAKDIEDLETALKKQRTAADKGEAGIAELENGYRKLENTLRGVAAAFDLPGGSRRRTPHSRGPHNGSRGHARSKRRSTPPW